METFHSDTRKRRKVQAMEGLYLRAPGALVAISIRVRGKVDLFCFRWAVQRVCEIYPTLRYALEWDAEGEAWFVETDAVAEARVYRRDSEATWRELIMREWRKPFELDDRPFARFFCVYDPEVSELVFLSQHTFIDGVGKTKLMDTLLRLLANPEMPIEPEEEPAYPSEEAFAACRPPKTRATLWLRYYQWWEDRLYMYLAADWKRHRAPIEPENARELQERFFQEFDYVWPDTELTEEETFALMRACRENDVTLNTVLCVAFLACRAQIDPEHENGKQMISVDLRRHLGRTALRSLACFASSLDIHFRYDARKGFWENAQRFHAKVRVQLDTFMDARKPLTLSRLPISYLEAATIAQRIVAPGSPLRKLPSLRKLDRHGLTSAKRFARGMLRRHAALSITNLGTGKFADTYGQLKVERCIVFPSCLPDPPFEVLLASIVVNRRLSYVLNIARPKRGMPNFDRQLEALLRRFRRFLTVDIHMRETTAQ